MIFSVEKSQVPFLYSMLHQVGRVTKSKLVPKNCLRYLQATLIMGVSSQNLSKVFSKKSMKNEKGFGKTWHFFA